MIKNVNLNVVERKVKTYQRKQAFVNRNDIPIIFIAYPLIFPMGEHLSREKVVDGRGEEFRYSQTTKKDKLVVQEIFISVSQQM